MTITNADRDDALEGVEEGKTVSQDLARSSGSVTSGHTPGPWLLVGNTVYALEHAGWRKGVEQLRNRFSANVQHGPQTPDGEVAANARLIAAAPDLLAALEALGRAVYGSAPGDEPDVYADYDQLNEHFSAYLAAISKATGLAPSSAAQVAGQVPGMNTETQLSTGEQP